MNNAASAPPQPPSWRGRTGRADPLPGGQHEAEIAAFVDRRRKRGFSRNELEMGGKFPCAKTGLVKALAPRSTAVEDIEMLAFIVIGPRLAGKFEMRLDDIGGLDQNKRRALLPILVHQDIESLKIPSLHRRLDLASRRLMANLVAADGLKADRLEHMDGVHHPADGRLPVNGLQNAARRRGRHHVIGDTLHLHFRASETGVVARDFETDSVGQDTALCGWEFPFSFSTRLNLGKRL